MEYLSIKDLTKSFTSPGGRITVALRQTSFELAKGQILSVVGHNGSGKTTLLNCIRGAFPFDKGKILVDGKNIRAVNPRIVSVYQDVEVGIVGSMTALENLTLVKSNRWSFLWSFPCRRYRREIYDTLESVSLSGRFLEFEHTPVCELSGGQRQQLAIIMAMLREPDILLLDEFVANLDPAISAKILDFIQAWIRKKQVATIVVTHDQDLAHRWADDTLELSDGAVVRRSATSG